ncbi:hypothetical protein RM533_07005 [Croceicoccus sp. F390]|uniref:Uncharacterized protein n=1 Tax=Croceicoccus esteveae TaxID=3075597 RepID=A0ABU2ZI90_9SPHN|nr:hypothetical protein [Croceicoccus sp. F390]MDT0575931.1 hypothetical protein [Croceicoccus sp. F390]
MSGFQPAHLAAPLGQELARERIVLRAYWRGMREQIKRYFFAPLLKMAHHVDETNRMSVNQRGNHEIHTRPAELQRVVRAVDDAALM